METINPKVGLKERCDYYVVSTGGEYDFLYIYQFYDSYLQYTPDRHAVYWTNREAVDHEGDIITYKGKIYYPIAYGGPLPQYTLTDEEIILTYADPSWGGECRLVVNWEYDLVVTYSNDGAFAVGNILDLVE